MKVNHSIILTVHNKGWLIDKVIQNIYKNTVGSYELIVILDGCTDNSEEVVLENVHRDATILYAANVFETTANNIGLRRATGEKVIIVQDDMVITEEAWNKRLQKPFAGITPCSPLYPFQTLSKRALIPFSADLSQYYLFS